jgi:hypothetical protein
MAIVEFKPRRYKRLITTPIVYHNKDEKPKKWQGNDDVFLHMNQVRVGLELLYWGRLDHGSVWQVVEIKTYTKNGRAIKVNNVQTPRDNIVLLRMGTNETHQISFTYMSYSAIWRLR